MAKKCPENLEKILPFVGLNLKNSFLIKYTGNIRATRKTNFKVYECERMVEEEKYLKKHLLYCLNCTIKYVKFLNKQKNGSKSIRDLDKDYLSLSK